MKEKKHYQKPAMREFILSHTPRLFVGSSPEPGTYIPSLTNNEDMNQLA